MGSHEPTSVDEPLSPRKRVKVEGAASSMPMNMEAAPAPDIRTSTLDDQASKEANCGITEFVCPDLLGFTGILKKRYTDFLVNEILPSGDVVHLDDLQAPKRNKGTGNAPRSSLPSHPPPNTQERVGDGSVEEDVDEKPSEATPATGTDGSHSSSQTPKLEKDETAPLPKPTIPHSMQDFDSPPKGPKNLAPHMRVPPPSASIPLSMRDEDHSKPSPTPTRKKETVHIRHTSQGWTEVDAHEAQGMNASAPATAEITHETPSDQQSVDTGIQDAVVQDPSVKKGAPAGAPPSTQEAWQDFAVSTSAEAKAENDFQLKSEDMTALLSYFGPSVVNEILVLHDRILTSPHRKAKDHSTVKSAVIDRQTRSKIHQDIRRIFESRFETVTDNDGHMIISAMSETPKFHGRTSMDNNYGGSAGQGDRGRNSRGRGGQRGNSSRDANPRQSRQSQWADLGGDYLHFSLCKENKDTMEAVGWLARQLNMKPAAFQFAGTKDRRGVTVQRVSVFRVFADRMIAAGRTLRGSKIGNFRYQTQGLQLGELQGNEFTITLRDCDFHYPGTADSKSVVEAAEAVVGEAIKNLGEHGFINYYGLQRFGTFSTSTDQVGVKILQGDFEGAVEGILHFEPATLEEAQDPMTAPVDRISREDQARAHAISQFKTTGKSTPALDNLPRKYSTESNIIRYLGNQNSKNDYLGALQTINRNMRLMYVHAYQSLVWNVAASHRWKKFGASVLKGDLVLIDDHRDKAGTEPSVEDIDADGEAIVHPSEDDRAADPESKFTRARALSQEEAESGEYSIFDVVLPTPGYDILYPANDMAKFYEDFMGSERGGGLDPHDMRRKWKDASLSGSYRKLLARPSKDFSFEVKVYKDSDAQFVQTDLDRLEKAKRERIDAQHSRSAPIQDDPAKAQLKKEDKNAVRVDLEADTKPQDPPSDSESGGVKLSGGSHRDYKIAVILKLQLGSSQYATMALRELMKHGGARAYKADFSGGH